jgi:hypothetical protein
VTGVANGSFAANGNDKTAEVVGSFSVANTGNSTTYQASGLFGAGRVGTVNPNGNLERLRPITFSLEWRGKAQEGGGGSSDCGITWVQWMIGRGNCRKLPKIMAVSEKHNP